MVKIKNLLGDVKIGKQGEVVYQRKYGEQVRRLVSPKRAIVSEAQEKHRQLYRAALDWRKGLSLANRRYLDGYCIANWVVDNQHIPLPWSRFALKIYLQAVKFVIITKPIAGMAGEEQKYESHELYDQAGASTYGIYRQGQTFTPQETHQITKVYLKLYRKGSPPVCRVSIYKVDANHLPTGNELTGVDKDLSGITPTIPGEFIDFQLPPHLLVAFSEYAIIMANPDGDSTNCPNWRRDLLGTKYTRGTRVFSSDSGQSWLPAPDQDFLFQDWGCMPPTEDVIGLLHVRHPALLAVVQKRGDLIVNGFDTLSSLDEEYITKQVGLDVLSGDSIEVTTLPGLKYTYQVA